jgi:hypothetical protein
MRIRAPPGNWIRRQRGLACATWHPDDDSGGDVLAKGGPAAGREWRWLTAEVAATGLAYGSGLCWASTCLLASFRPNHLSVPYWSALPGLRTDTCGIAAFLVVAVALTASEYLRLRRRAAPPAPRPAPPAGSVALLAQAVAQTVAVLATGLVTYLSVNAVTHPATLDLQATHLAPWPAEGTLRVIALLLCACSAAVLRYLRAAASGPAGRS